MICLLYWLCVAGFLLPWCGGCGCCVCEVVQVKLVGSFVFVDGAWLLFSFACVVVLWLVVGAVVVFDEMVQVELALGRGFVVCGFCRHCLYGVVLLFLLL